MDKDRISYPILGTMLLASTIATASIGWLPAETTGKVAAIFPPWVDGATVTSAVSEADGLIVSTTATGFAIVAQSDRPGFVAHLYSAGALAVLATDAFGCSI